MSRSAGVNLANLCQIAWYALHHFLPADFTCFVASLQCAGSISRIEKSSCLRADCLAQCHSNVPFSNSISAGNPWANVFLHSLESAAISKRILSARLHKPFGRAGACIEMADLSASILALVPMLEQRHASSVRLTSKKYRHSSIELTFNNCPGHQEMSHRSFDDLISRC